MKRIVQFCLPLFLVASVAVNASSSHDLDPWEKFNRATFAFNTKLDQWLLRPTAKTYQAITPQFVHTGIRNVFNNLRVIHGVVNYSLQGDIKKAAVGAGDFLINTTVGVGGIFDVSQQMGLDTAPTSFGQTLGKWGVGSGNYLVLPVLGSSTVRDGTGLIIDSSLSVLNYVQPPEDRFAGVALNAISARANLFKAEALITGDQYIFLRDTYLQSRGLVQEEEGEGFGDQDFEDFEDF